MCRVGESNASGYFTMTVVLLELVAARTYELMYIVCLYRRALKKRTWKVKNKKAKAGIGPMSIGAVEPVVLVM